jgi:hypothetical protein
MTKPNISNLFSLTQNPREKAILCKPFNDNNLRYQTSGITHAKSRKKESKIDQNRVKIEKYRQKTIQNRPKMNRKIALMKLISVNKRPNYRHSAYLPRKLPKHSLPSQCYTIRRFSLSNLC